MPCFLICKVLNKGRIKVYNASKKIEYLKFCSIIIDELEDIYYYETTSSLKSKFAGIILNILIDKMCELLDALISDIKDFCLKKSDPNAGNQNNIIIEKLLEMLKDLQSKYITICKDATYEDNSEKMYMEFQLTKVLKEVLTFIILDGKE